MTPKILIVHNADLGRGKYNYFDRIETRMLHQAAIVIISDGRHFRCVKNRWDIVGEGEKIPLSLLTAYLMLYEDKFSKQDLFAALAYETTS